MDNLFEDLIELSSEDINWKSEVENCLNGKYVLVLGSKAILNERFFPNTNGDTTVLFEQELRKIFKGYNLWTRDNVRDCIKKMKTSWANNDVFEMIDPYLLLLLKTKCFRLILTTCYDPILEMVLEKIWAEENLRVLDIYSNENDFKEGEQGQMEFYDIPPTLYYVFGKAVPSLPAKKFVVQEYNENDGLDVISKWIGVGNPSNLLNYLRDKDIMALGCDFEDWLFRFFWYSLKLGVKEDRENRFKAGAVVVNFNDDRTSEYVERQHINHFHDVHNFMGLLAREILQGKEPEDLLLFRGGIFISYASEDYNYAYELYKKLKKSNFNVWLDKLIFPGDEYENRIFSAISQCRIFMPILSGQTKVDLKMAQEPATKDEHRKRYYRKEWIFAQERYMKEEEKGKHKMITIPIVSAPYSLGDDYHQNIVQKEAPCIYKASASSYEDKLRNFDSYTEFVERLKNLLRNE